MFLTWLGWALGGFFGGGVRSADPPHSVPGHGLGYRAAKLRHGTVGFSCSFIFRPADALLSPETGERPG